MAGPTQNFTPGNRDSAASAIRCAEECQKVDLPSLSSQVSNFNVLSCLIGRVASQTSIFTLTAKTFLAYPSLIDLAMSRAELPSGYSRTAPSGNVIFIIFYFCPP